MRMSIRGLRAHRKMTQQELADHVGVNKKTVALWENGETTPNVDKVDKICEALGVGYDDIEWKVAKEA